MPIVYQYEPDLENANPILSPNTFTLTVEIDNKGKELYFYCPDPVLLVKYAQRHFSKLNWTMVNDNHATGKFVREIEFIYENRS